MPEAVLASSVYAIIGAYTKAQTILRQIKETASNPRVKSRLTLNGEELRLQSVLAKAPADIQGSYLHGLQTCGRKYAAGDSNSRAQLTGLLMKINFGLVDNLASFLKDTSSRRPPLDCNGLSALSEHVQTETRAILGRLCHKLSFSEQPQYSLWLCQRCGSSQHKTCDPFAIEAPSHSSVSKPRPDHSRSTSSGNRQRRNSVSSSASSMTSSTYSKASSYGTTSTAQTTPSIASNNTTPYSSYSASSASYQPGVDYFNHKPSSHRGHTHSSSPSTDDALSTSLSKLSMASRSAQTPQWTAALDPATARRLEAAAALTGANTCDDSEETGRRKNGGSGLLKKVFRKDIAA